jgi:hypothetical protein
METFGSDHQMGSDVAFSTLAPDKVPHPAAALTIPPLVDRSTPSRNFPESA